MRTRIPWATERKPKHRSFVAQPDNLSRAESHIEFSSVKGRNGVECISIPSARLRINTGRILQCPRDDRRCRRPFAPWLCPATRRSGEGVRRQLFFKIGMKISLMTLLRKKEVTLSNNGRLWVQTSCQSWAHLWTTFHFRPLDARLLRSLTARFTRRRFWEVTVGCVDIKIIRRGAPVVQGGRKRGKFPVAVELPRRGQHTGAKLEHRTTIMHPRGV
jgi:hypothetical protein